MFEAYGLSAAFGIYSLIPFAIGGAFMALLVRRLEHPAAKAAVVVAVGGAEAVGAWLLVMRTGFAPPEPKALGFLVSPVWFGLKPNVISLVFFWLPISVQAVYCLRAKPPRPIIAALVSVGVLAAGILFFVVGGSLTGATSD